ncbi:MAG: ABC transporter permease subunit [Anaerolineales bacterium]|jgi:ABC-2 type transport system permease protein
MNIYIHEFKMHLRSVIIWSLSQAVMIFVFTWIFSSMAVDSALLTETLTKFPKELLIAFGMENLDMSTVLGFFSFAFLFCQILLSIQAANYGFGILSMEERELTADFLMTKPVSRRRILFSKVLAALTGLTITNIVVWISSFIFINMFRGGRPFDSGTLVKLLLSIIVFQLVFLTLGMVISLLVRRVRNVTPFSMGLAFGMYVLGAFGGMLGDVKLELITPFKHFDPNYIIKNQAYPSTIWISVAYIVIAAIGTYVLYQRRNIPAPV